MIVIFRGITPGPLADLCAQPHQGSTSTSSQPQVVLAPASGTTQAGAELFHRRPSHQLTLPPRYSEVRAGVI